MRTWPNSLSEGMGGLYYVETYGCTLNKTDTALIEEKLRLLGLVPAKNPEEADVIVVNTCTVRKDAEERALTRIRELCGLGKMLLVAGCLATAQPAFVREACESAILVSTMELSALADVVTGRKRWVTVEELVRLKAEEPALYKRGPTVAVPLVDGCADSCSFCITKLARPYLVSRKPISVLRRLKETLRLMPYDVCEVQLTGQDLAVYGLDLEGKQMLPRLLAEVLSLDVGGKLIKVRLGMMTPHRFSMIADEVLELAKKDERVYRFFHIPVQSGDNRVLRIMRRGYRVEQFVELVRKIRSALNDVQLATDVIVGHPGEDEEAFRNTLRLLENIRPERIHIARFTPRPHTLSAMLPQVPDPVKKERSTALLRLYERIGYEWHAKMLNRRVRVYVVEKFYWRGREHIIGRTDNYVSVVLGNASEDILGKVAEAYIDEVTYFDARGRVYRYLPPQ